MNDRIKGLFRRDDILVRLDICATYFSMTWAADDRQLVVFDDGVDLAHPPTKAYHSCIHAIAGDPPHPTFHTEPGYPDMPMRVTESEYASFWGGTCLAVDGRVYQYLANSNHRYFMPDGGKRSPCTHPNAAA